MLDRKTLILRWLIAVPLLLGAFPPLATAGPPLLCQPFAIGNATSLPWGAGWRERKSDYKADQVASDLRTLLGPSTPVLVRMETLRRAALYLQDDPRLGREVLASLTARATEHPNVALAWFDAGYFAATLQQSGYMNRNERPRAVAIDGYEWVQKAIALASAPAEMEFAAWLIALDRKDGSAAAHLARAKEAATAGSLLAKNLVSAEQHFGGH